MATGVREIVAPAEIPVDRLFRLNADRVRHGVDVGILEAGYRSGGRLRLDQYRSLNEAGLVTKDDRVELLGGWLVARTPINLPHRISTRKARLALDQIIPLGWYPDEQKPISPPIPDSEPEPDVQVTRGRTEDYFDRHSSPENIGLVVEVPDASLRDEQGMEKTPLRG